VGHYLVCRDGKKVFLLHIIGFCLADDPNGFAELVRPTLEQLRTYRP
jgi:hypothetical protein